MSATDIKYHLGFGQADLGDDPPRLAVLCGDPERTRAIAFETTDVHCERELSTRRGLNSYLLTLANGKRLIAATSGMGAPSLSIVVNELVDLGIRQVIRVGTSGSIQEDVKVGSLVISRAALCRQGAANDIAPLEYPAAANPFLTLALVEAAEQLALPWHLGVTASVDTFYEGQERTVSSANKHLLRHLQGITAEYRHLNILNYEMEAGTLFKMAGVYGFAAACICGVLADRTSSEAVMEAQKQAAVAGAIRVALQAAASLDSRYLQPAYLR
ncbi:nucleoside phosphorylase [Desulfuromonas sp. AOP6]|uniref:nucleoside phosphorylase n=1 Tax=Desulfuromonas sp. AOP6 TaxID=1566351 RepID=UPI00127D6C15|nr:nucleoside phosphorylase [Desulfuromonas sp. AOP6]BCA79268.1 uridine phosphorylase [Desulfuromonas sp. AOP6]